MATRFFPRFEGNLITSRFGQRIHPVTKIKTMHNGIDLVASNDGKTGQTDYITAHTGGTVEAVGYDLASGNYVKIRVDERTQMVYCHLKNKAALKKGSLVAAGDVLGYMGKTGSATGEHLHFGIRVDGKWIDPEAYLSKDWSSAVQQVAVSLPVLRRGHRSESVRAMQQLLIAKGFGCGQAGADGDFGEATFQALQAFQKSVSLEADGICGILSWNKLLGQ